MKANKETVKKITMGGSVTIEAALILTLLICFFVGALYLSVDAIAGIREAGEKMVEQYQESMDERDAPGWIRKIYALQSGLGD